MDDRQRIKPSYPTGLYGIHRQAVDEGNLTHIPSPGQAGGKEGKEMSDIKKVQEIGTWVCDECSDDSDCGIKPEECDRIEEAIKVLKETEGEEEEP